MRGSFSRLVEALEKRLEAAGATLHLSDPAKHIDRENGHFVVRTRGSKFKSSRVLVATPVVDYLDVAGHLLNPTEAAALRGLRSTAALCTVLELERSLTPYYWLNIADPAMPFGGLIEHTNYIPPDRYGGRHILYISNYLFPDHPLYRRPKREVLELYSPALRRVNPRFDDSWIRASHHFRAESAQPVVTLGYPQQIPDIRASVPGLYLCTMAQIYPEDRGQNYAIVYGEKTAAALLDDLRSA
jgi:protoporphyrinogen oxidase